MCGIAGGIWTAGGEPLTPKTLSRMVSILSHRGPDGDGTLIRPVSDGGAGLGVALGHRRLSIIDIDGGKQPLANEDETVWITFNGEIFNYRELRKDLEASGHVFRTQCDTETIVHLYEEHGDDCLKHLRGQFAFALWDSRRNRLLLARDRLGQKPLFYRRENKRLLFASELKSLLEVPNAPRELNRPAVDAFLTYQYVPHPACILAGYHKLPPGHYAVFEGDRFEVRRYWSPPYSPDDDSRYDWNETQRWSPADWQRELQDALTEAVELRLRSDVPLGAFLSGGMDSTIITGLMQRLAGERVHSFSIGFPVKQFDESSYAEEAAAFLGTEHHKFVVEPQALEILPKLVWHYDEPFADSSAIPMMWLSEMTRREVTVALSGDGGDELFAGYDRYRAVRMAARFDSLPQPLRAIARSRIWQKLPASVEQKSFRRRLKRFLAALREPPEERYLTWISIFDQTRREALYTDAFRESLADANSSNFITDAYQHCPSRDFVTRTTAADVLTYLPCDILTKVDIATMAYGLEARSPFLDHRVAELAARMPIQLKLKGKQGKQILLDTFGDLIPKSIQSRRKMGFGVPLDSWFRNELKPLLYDTLLSEAAISRGLFRPEQIRRLLDEHSDRKWDHSYRLWALLVLELWMQRK